jgi:hypothetical protein
MTQIQAAIFSCITSGKRPRKAYQYASIKNRPLSIAPASSQRDENHSAQGCEATLGHRYNQFFNPERVASSGAQR